MDPNRNAPIANPLAAICVVTKGGAISVTLDGGGMLRDFSLKTLHEKDRKKRLQESVKMPLHRRNTKTS